MSIVLVIAIVAGAVFIVLSLVLTVVLVRRVGGLSLGRTISEHPMEIGSEIRLPVPNVEGRLVVGVRLGFSYQRYTTGTMPDVAIEVSVDSLGTALFSGTFARTGAEFQMRERWSGKDAWRISTRRVVELPPVPSGSTLRVTVSSTRSEQITDVGLVLAETG